MMLLLTCWKVLQLVVGQPQVPQRPQPSNLRTEKLQGIVAEVQ